MVRRGTTFIREKFSDSEDFYFALQEGRISGMSLVEKFGRNNDIDDATEEDIFVFGGNFVYPTTPATISVLSSDTEDSGLTSPLGTGAFDVTVYGCDANYAEINETFTLNGTTPVGSATSPLTKFLRVWRVKCGAVGTGGSNAGNIKVVDANSPEGVLGYILIGQGQSEQCQYTVPAGKTAHIIGGKASVAESPGGALKETSALVKIWVRDYNAASTNNYNSWRMIESADINNRGAGNVDLDSASRIAAKSDIRVSAAVSADNTQVDVRLNIVLVDD